MKNNIFLSLLLTLLLALNFTIPTQAAHLFIPTTWTVTKTANTNDGTCDADCSLREAITAAASGDIIVFDTSLSGQTIVLGISVSINKDLTLDGSSLASRLTINGDASDQIFVISSGVVTINNLILRSGFCGFTLPTCNGGAINNNGTLTLTNSDIFSSFALHQGGAIWNGGTLTIENGSIYHNSTKVVDGVFEDGGGIYNSATGTVTIKNSVIYGNNASFGSAIYSLGSVTIVNSTLSGNSSSSIYNTNTLTLVNTTVSTQGEYGIYNTGTLNYSNSIVANALTTDCFNSGTLGTNTNNLGGDGTCSAALSGDPLLRSLADNGGSTLTHALRPASPAIDAGSNAICATAPVNNLDQRGTTRPINATCDIGAYEAAPDIISPSVISITRASANPTNAASVNFTVTFSELVTGVGTSDFTVTTSGLAGASVAGITPVNTTTYTVTVNTGNGEGTLRLDLADDDTILDDASNPLGGSGTGNGNFTSGESYNVDRVAPSVLSIVRTGTNPTEESRTVTFTVTFSEPVMGSNYSLTTSGLSGAFISGSSGSGTATHTVSVNCGSGTGTVRLDVIDTDGMTDATGNPLGGTGSGNGNFTSGEVYTIVADTTFPIVSSIKRDVSISNPTNSSDVIFDVTFSEEVTGVNKDDFFFTSSGLSGISVVSVGGSGANYSVMVHTDSGSGTIRLNVTDNDTIADVVGNKLGGTGTGNDNFSAGESFTIDRTGPVITSTTLASPTPTNASSVDFTVNFNETASEVDINDFALNVSGVSGASVTGVTGSGTTYTVSVSTGTGNGTIQLKAVATPSIVDGFGNSYGGDLGNYTAYNIDRENPSVACIFSVDPNPTSASTITFYIFFTSCTELGAEDVVNLDPSDFALTTTGSISGATINDISNYPDSTFAKVVTVNTGSGNGTIRLDFVDDNTVTDQAGNPIGGAGAGNGNFSSGTVYTVSKNSAPTNISLSASTVNENQPSGTTVGTLTTTDADDTDTHTYSFACSTPGSDDASFQISGSSLQTNAVFNFEVKNSYSICIRTNDGHSGTFDKDITISVTDVDEIAPRVLSIVRLDATPTSKLSVRFTVTFSEPVTGVGAVDFALTKTGLTGGSVTGVSGSGATRTVTVSTGTGNGTLRLDVPNTATVTDAAGNPLTTVPFTSGQVYTVQKILTVLSTATQDGWILESGETTNTGGILDAGSATFNLGDDALDKQYRAVVSFNTASLPDNAIITKVTLKLKLNSTAGTSPFTTHGNLMVDIIKGTFSANSGLQALDFNAAATQASAGTIPSTPVSGYYTKVWTSGVLGSINLTGLTQFRLRFQLDDNDDLGTDLLRFFSGNSTTAGTQPTLVIEYHQ